MMVKDGDRVADTNGWGFFNFGHHEPPHAETVTTASAAECASCHADNAATEMVFGKFYPILGQNRGRDRVRWCGPVKMQWIRIEFR